MVACYKTIRYLQLCDKTWYGIMTDLGNMSVLMKPSTETQND